LFYLTHQWIIHWKEEKYFTKITKNFSCSSFYHPLCQPLNNLFFILLVYKKLTWVSLSNKWINHCLSHQSHSCWQFKSTATPKCLSKWKHCITCVHFWPKVFPSNKNTTFAASFTRYFSPFRPFGSGFGENDTSFFHWIKQIGLWHGTFHDEFLHQTKLEWHLNMLETIF